MHEIALSITARDVIKAKNRTYEPVGSVVSAVSRWKKRLKWVEVVCDLASPQKREMYRVDILANYDWKPQIWNRFCEAWTPQLQSYWNDLKKMPIGTPVQRASKNAAAEDIWVNHIESIPGFIPSLGKEPLGNQNLTDAWPWSTRDRKKQFIVVNDDATYDEIEQAGKKETYTDGGLIVVKPSRRILWETELELTEEEVEDIRDSDKKVHPRFDKMVAKGKIKTVPNPT